MAKKAKFKQRNGISSHRSNNNAVRTNYVKAKIIKTQQNSKCRFYRERDET